MTRHDIPCAEVVAEVTNYLEGALPEELAVEIEMHLVLCADCSRYLRQMRETIKLTGRVGLEPVPPELEAQLLALFRSARGAT